VENRKSFLHAKAPDPAGSKTRYSPTRQRSLGLPAHADTRCAAARKPLFAVSATFDLIPTDITSHPVSTEMAPRARRVS
jgi:hypothetical protein